ncbi:MAG: NAD-binding protein [Acidobacteriota bacterium]|nr:MAG: NAD-binding protein [Acidobacteriota bacterium]
MKLIATQLSYFFNQGVVRQNLRALLKFLLLLILVILIYTVLFHLIMQQIEEQEHSWLTGLYWTLTVMSTLGFGDITFQSDIGRLFSIVVLLSGIVLLLIMLPFAFIRYFYAPWLEAQLRWQTPREVEPDVRDHVIICRYDSIAPGLIRKLRFNRIPVYVLEPDPVAAAQLMNDELPVVTGEIDSRETYERLRAGEARMVLANAEDTTNTNVTLTVREVAPEVPIVAIVENEDSLDILELSGATHAMYLKRKLGEYLASRVALGRRRIHVIGSFRDVMIAEFTAQNTPLAGLTLRESRLRETTGLSVVGVWERAHLSPPSPDLRLNEQSVPVVIGLRDQIIALENLVAEDEETHHPVVIIGGGKVGRAAARELRSRGVKCHIVDRKQELAPRIGTIPDRLVIGDAADREVLMRAGLAEASAVILSTNDDAMNIYLSIYCCKLNPDLRIISRITHERNIEAIYRAGADYVLSYASLGRETIFSLIMGREPILVEEGIDLFISPAPESLAGKTLAESRIGERTGLIVIGIEEGDRCLTNPRPDQMLTPGCNLLMLGSDQQRQSFTDIYED